MEIEFNDWDDYERTDIPKTQKLDLNLENRIENITFNYDRGRVTVYFDGIEVFNSLSAGSDFQLVFIFNKEENKHGS